MFSEASKQSKYRDVSYYSYRLRKKQQHKASEVAKKLIVAWDVRRDEKLLLDTFTKHKDELAEEYYWEILRSVWIICGSVENAQLFRGFFTQNKRSMFAFMSPDCHEALRRMPEEFAVYRACNDVNDGGLSWTTSKTYADLYKGIYGKQHLIEKAVCKTEVFAYLDRNKEQEIIIL